MAVDRLFDDITEELGAAMTSFERGPFRNFREVPPDGRSISFFVCSSSLSWPIFGRKWGARGHGRKAKW